MRTPQPLEVTLLWEFAHPDRQDGELLWGEEAIYLAPQTNHSSRAVISNTKLTWSPPQDEEGDTGQKAAKGKGFGKER